MESIHARLTRSLGAIGDAAIAADIVAVTALNEADAALRAIRSIDDPAVPADFVQGAPWLELLAASNSARNIS